MDALIKIFSARLWIITDLLRYLFIWLDGMIYGLIQPIYSIALKLSNLRNFFTAEDIARTTAQNIYVFLALFMLFKLAFSIISMIANPDMAADKQKGLGKVLTNAVITIILVVIMPTVFNLAYNVQDVLINDGVLSGIFTNLGENSKGLTETEGEKISKNIFKVFIGENPNITNKNKDASEALNNFEKEGITALSRKDAIVKNYDGQYQIYYMMLISTAVGVMVLISFIKMCVEIALRSIKLIMIEVISPIAIISYLDPQSASKGIFSKWSSIAMKTYLSLFIRLGTLYFLTTLLANIDPEKFGSMTESGFGVFETLFVVLAIVTFMQTAPKFFEEMFGYKPGEDGKAIKGIVNGALGLGMGAGAAAMHIGAQGIGNLGRMARGEAPRKIKYSDVFKAGLGGAKSASKSGLLGAAFSEKAKDLQYSKNIQARRKERDENWQKKAESNAMKRVGFANTFDEMEATLPGDVAAYAGNAANFASDTLYNTLSNTATSLPMGSRERSEAEARLNSYTKEMAKEKLKGKFNEAVYQAPVAKRKNAIGESKVQLGVYEDQKVQRQAEFDRILRGEVLYDETGTIISKEMAVERIITVNNQISSTNAFIEKTKGELETLFKDPKYAKDARIEAGMKLDKARS